ncbi:hypothetical protein, partial [Xanthomonas perforans]|uniref:hypothetical protein n=1 Tax=Xanthomonas perforans TaxID=442694 RepID=UPI001F454ADA
WGRLGRWVNRAATAVPHRFGYLVAGPAVPTVVALSRWLKWLYMMINCKLIETIYANAKF